MSDRCTCCEGVGFTCSRCRHPMEIGREDAELCLYCIAYDREQRAKEYGAAVNESARRREP